MTRWTLSAVLLLAHLLFVLPLGQAAHAAGGCGDAVAGQDVCPAPGTLQRSDRQIDGKTCAACVIFDSTRPAPHRQGMQQLALQFEADSHSGRTLLPPRRPPRA